jgi:hypothetical protein
MFNIFPFRAKLALLTTIIILGVTGSVTFLSSKKEQNYYEEHLTETADLLLNSMDIMVRDDLDSLKIDDIIKHIKNFKEYQTIIDSVCIFDAQGRVIINSQKAVLDFKSVPMF